MIAKKKLKLYKTHPIKTLGIRSLDGNKVSYAEGVLANEWMFYNHARKEAKLACRCDLEHIERKYSAAGHLGNISAHRPYN